MSLLADFDPLNSPVNANKVAADASSPSSAAVAPAAAASSAKSASKQKKFDGTNPDFLYTAKWHSLRSSATHSYALSFAAPKPKIVNHEEDPVARIVAEREAKAKADAEKAEQEREQEKQRQEEARAAAAAGKEEIGEDVKKVELPGPELSSGVGAAPAASASPPVDSSVAKAQQALEKATAELNRYADKATFRYTSSEDSKDVDPPVASQVVYTGAFELQNKSNIVLTDVSKTTTKGSAEPVKTDVGGSFTLNITPDGKKITGQIESEALEFELLDSSDPDKALAAILGY